MYHDRYARRLEPGIAELGSARARGGRELATRDPGEVHPRLLEHGPVTQDPRAPAATFGPLPDILVKPRRAILLGELGAHISLEASQIFVDG